MYTTTHRWVSSDTRKFPGCICRKGGNGLVAVIPCEVELEVWDPIGDHVKVMCLSEVSVWGFNVIVVLHGVDGGGENASAMIQVGRYTRFGITWAPGEVGRKEGQGGKGRLGGRGRARRKEGVNKCLQTCNKRIAIVQ